MLSNVKVPEPESVPEGKRFLGWYLSGEETPYDLLSAQQATVILYPRFADLVTVTFRLDDESDPLQSITTDKGSVLDPSEIPSPTPPEGKVFRGWFLVKTPEEEATPWDSTAPVTATATYYAVFQDAES